MQQVAAEKSDEEAADLLKRLACPAPAIFKLWSPASDETTGPNPPVFRVGDATINGAPAVSQSTREIKNVMYRFVGCSMS